MYCVDDGGAGLQPVVYCVDDKGAGLPCVLCR